MSKLMNTFKIDDSVILLLRCAKMPLAMLVNDALDLFHAMREQPFSKADIAGVLRASNTDLSTFKFSGNKPFWSYMVMKK